MSSTNQTEYPTEPGERRLLFIRCDKEHLGKDEAAVQYYFAWLYAAIQDPGTAVAFVAHLRSRDISAWDPERDNPRTPAQRAMEQRGRPVLLQWLAHESCASDSSLPVPDELAPKQLHERFCDFCDTKSLDAGKLTSLETFGSALGQQVVELLDIPHVKHPNPVMYKHKSGTQWYRINRPALHAFLLHKGVIASSPNQEQAAAVPGATLTAGAAATTSGAAAIAILVSGGPDTLGPVETVEGPGALHGPL
jgi:hypothetical protein